MVEPSDNLQAVFERAIETAKKLHHEYLTIEHLLFAMLADDGFYNTIAGFGADADNLKNDLTDYLQFYLLKIYLKLLLYKNFANIFR